MSLNNQDLAQKKVKSLRDLFGGSLTEDGKSVLEKAADSAARDLTLAVFGPADTPTIEDSVAGRDEAVEWGRKYPVLHRAVVSQAGTYILVVQMDNLIKSQAHLNAKLSHLKKYLGRPSFAGAIPSGDVLPYKGNGSAFCISDAGELLAINNVKVKDYKFSLLKKNNITVRGMSGNIVKATIEPVQYEPGKKDFAFGPVMFKPVSTKTLPRLVRNRRQTHKVK